MCVCVLYTTLVKYVVALCYMYVCMYVYIYIYIYTERKRERIYTHICIRIYCAYIYIYIYACMHVCMHVCVYVYIAYIHIVYVYMYSSMVLAIKLLRHAGSNACIHALTNDVARTAFIQTPERMVMETRVCMHICTHASRCLGRWEPWRIRAIQESWSNLRCAVCLRVIAKMCMGLWCVYYTCWYVWVVDATVHATTCVVDVSVCALCMQLCVRCKFRYIGESFAFRRARLTFKRARLTFKRARLTFKRARLTFKRARLTFKYACLTFKRARLTFKRARLTFKRARLTYISLPCSSLRIAEQPQRYVNIIITYLYFAYEHAYVLCAPPLLAALWLLKVDHENVIMCACMRLCMYVCCLLH
jgi:hypothetical protein